VGRLGTTLRGIAFQAGATGELSRVAISNVTEIGVLLGQAGTSVRLSDIVITDVASRPSGFFGRGLTLQNEAELWLTRGRIERVHEVGAMCSLGSRLVLEDVVISEVEPQPCGDGGGCSALPGGHGLGAYADSTIEATRFVVSDIALCGLHVALDSLQPDPVASTQPTPLTSVAENYDFRSGGRLDATAQPQTFVGKESEPWYSMQQAWQLLPPKARLARRNYAPWR